MWLDSLQGTGCNAATGGKSVVEWLAFMKNCIAGWNCGIVVNVSCKVFGVIVAKALYPKKRYVAFRVTGPDRDSASPSRVWEHAFNSLFSFLGSIGMSRARFKQIGYDNESKKRIFRVTNAMHRRVLGCIVVSGPLAGKKARLQILRSSGSLKKLKEEIGIEIQNPKKI